MVRLLSVASDDAALVTVIVYGLLVLKSADVTTILIVLGPTFKLTRFPVPEVAGLVLIVNEAAGSVVVGITDMLVVVLGTLAV